MDDVLGFLEGGPPLPALDPGASGYVVVHPRNWLQRFWWRLRRRQTVFPVTVTSRDDSPGTFSVDLAPRE
jgi:hypothetical protein